MVRLVPSRIGLGRGLTPGPASLGGAAIQRRIFCHKVGLGPPLLGADPAAQDICKAVNEWAWPRLWGSVLLTSRQSWIGARVDILVRHRTRTWQGLC